MRQIKVGSTSVIFGDLFIQDSSSSTGAGLTGLAYNSGSLTCYYHRNTASSATAVTLADMTLGTFTSSGFKQVDSTNMPGIYSFCPPDAALASGAQTVSFLLKGASNMAPYAFQIELTASDVQDGTRLGLTALPNAAAEASGGLITRGTSTGQLSVSSGQVILQSGTGTGQLDFTSGVVKANVTQFGGTNATSSAGRPEVNTSHIAGSAVSTSSAQIGVNVVNLAGSAVSASSGLINANVTQLSGDATAADNAESFFDGTGYGAILQATTIATLSSQTSFTLTAGSADNDAYNGCVIVIQDASTAAQKAVGVIADYTGSTKTVTLLNDPAVFTMATSDIVTILADRALKPTVDNRTLDVTTSGEAGVDWANVGSPTTTVNLSGTTVKTATDVETDTQDIQSRLPTALGANGNIKADVRDYNGTAGTFSSGRPEVNTTHWKGTAAATVDTAGYPVVTVKDGTGAGEIALTSGAIDTVTTLTNAPSDSSGVTTLLSRVGTPSNLGSGATVAANLVDIEAQTDDIGTAGAGLTAIPWNASWDAEVQSEVDDALVAQNLDHLVKIAVDTNFATTVHADSVIGQIADNGAGFDRTTDSLEAIRDRGDAAWTTATGFSTLDAAGVRTAVGLASANLDTQLTAIDDYLDTEVAAIKAKTDSLTFTVSGKVDANLLAINGNTSGPVQLDRSTRGIVIGTVGSGSTTTSIVTSALSPSVTVADQLKGKIVTFSMDTTTAALRGQSTDITASTSGGVLSVTALTTAASSGDVFCVT